MPPISLSRPHFIITALLLPYLLLPLLARAQQDEEVVRVSTELVQTDVTVFDKAGKFVDGLKPEQFVLKVDGKEQAVTFFDRVTAGTADEDAQLAAARGIGRAKTVAMAGGASVKPLDRGRTIIFFIDDLHLAADSLARTRKLLLRFIDDQTGQNDQVAITTASGQIGFLQQFTDDKTVLRAAVARLGLRNVAARDNERPAMSESQAAAIERNDPDVLGFYVDFVIREYGPGTSRQSAENEARSRASRLLELSNDVAARTLSGLQSLMRTAAQLPGRKLAYFISDGFLLDTNRSETLDRLRRVTDAALRAGVVVYTLDARGLSTGGLYDASSEGTFDPTGRLSRGARNEIAETQDPLHLIADETGGRALLNTNALETAVVKALKETAVYYLLAWRPEQPTTAGDARRSKFRRLEVRVKDRPDLTVLVQRGFYTFSPPDEAVTGKPKTKDKAAPSSPATPPARSEIFKALGAVTPRTALPIALTAGFSRLHDKQVLLTVTVQLDSTALGLTADAQAGKIEVVGAIYDERGKFINGFQHQLTRTPPAAPPATTKQPPAAVVTTPLPDDIIYSQQFALAPGLYQVRAASRDPQTSRTGSASQWIDIPDLSVARLALSSIFLGEHPAVGAGGDKDAASGTPPSPVVISADHRFARTSALRFILYIYNAGIGNATATAAPDVALQVQIFRDDQPVITTPLRKVSTAGLTDLTFLPYAAELALEGLSAGHYVLQATAIDRTSKSSATQRVKFNIK